MRTAACGLSQPWEITYGPDGFLWVTEALSYQADRIDPVTGVSHLLANLSNRKNFANNANPSPQGGLMAAIADRKAICLPGLRLPVRQLCGR